MELPNRKRLDGTVKTIIKRRSIRRARFAANAAIAQGSNACSRPSSTFQKLPEDFLERNQQTHIDMNGQLGLQSVDLEDVDLKDPRQLQAWINFEYQELFAASAALGI